MNIRETKKRILSLLLALALCASTWAGDFQTVMATENTAATQEEQNSTGSDADSSITNSTDIGSNGDITSDTNSTDIGSNGDITSGTNSTDKGTNSDTTNDTTKGTNSDTVSGTNSSTDSDIDSSSGAENIINGTAVTKTEESGTETIIVTGDNGTENNGIGTDTGTQAVSGSGDNIDDDDTGEEETTLTDEDIEKNSIAIYDALYGEIEGNFNEECGKLYNSIASEYGLNDEDNGEITDELYAQFYAKFYESACTLLDKVVTEKLNTASEQEAYADLQNEAVYKKVYDSIHDKLYEEYVAGLKEMGITTLDSSSDNTPASGRDLNNSAEVTLADEVGVTNVTVTGDDVTMLTDTFTIDLSKVNVLTDTEISVEMNFELLQGVGDPDDGGTNISDRKIRGGDYYTITVPDGLIITALVGGTGDGIDLTTTGGMTVAKATLNENGNGITITFDNNINYDNEHWDVKYGLNMTMQLDKEQLETETTVDWESVKALGGPNYSFILPAAPADVPGEVIKTGKYIAKDNEIIWTIEIKGTPGVDIGGWTIVDTLDTLYQKYKSASFNGVGVECNERATTTANGSTATEYTYKIPENSTIPATLTIVTEPTSDILAELVDKDTKSDIVINNNVYLKNASDEETGLKTSGTATLPHTTPISKSGEVVSADLMHWTLTVNPGNAYIYGATVTDKLQSCLRLAGNGDEKNITIGNMTVKLMKVADGGPWTGSITDSNGDPIIECTYTENVGSEKNNILTINYVDGKDTLKGNSSKITFDTSIDLDDGTTGRYDNGPMEVTNIAEIECRFPDGKSGENTSYGTGPVNWEVSQNMIKKSVSDITDGCITWTIDPSIGTNTFNEAVIIDKIDQGENGSTSKQTFVKGSIQILLDNTNIIEDSNYKNYYNIEYDSGDNPTKLTITLNGTSNSSAGFSSDDLNKKIKITYQTHMDGLGTTVQDNGTAKNQIYYNKASMQVDGTTPTEDDASTTVIDKMLSKSSVTYYEDLADGGVMRGYKYTITVNEMGMKISNLKGVTPVVLTDDLSKIQPTYSDGTPATEAELALYKVVIFEDGREVYSTDKVEKENDYFDYRVGSGESLGKLETKGDFAKLAEDGSKVTVDLYVVITNADELFKQEIKLQAGNEAFVEVTTDTGNGTFKATAVGNSQESTISNDLITKNADSTNAQWGDEGLYSDWVICINPWSADMGNITITDKIPQAQSSYVSFDSGSVKLYEANHSPTGVVSISDTEAMVGYTVKNAKDENGDTVLTVTIPQCTRTYYLKYRTYYLDQNVGTSYKNYASLDGNDISDYAACEIKIASGAWAEATSRASITVNKTDDSAFGTSTAICGAKFALYNESGNQIREQLTDENGQIVFSGLSLNKQYTVKETGAAPGYEWSAEVADKNQKTVETSADNKKIELDFENTRTTGTVSFTKVDNNDPTKGLGGAKFLLYYTEDGVTKLVRTQSSGSNTDGSYKFLEFVNAASGDNALATDAENAGGVLVSAGSGTVGNIEVTGLPWGEGTYSFIETEGPNGYKADSTKHYEFTMRRPSSVDKPDPEYGANFAVTDAKGNIISDITEDISKDARYVIFNSKYKFKLIKQDESGNPIAGVEFGLYSDEACTKLVPLKENPFSTDENGTVLIDDSAIELSSADNPTCYYLKEISAPADYKVSPDVVQFYIDSTTKKVVVLNKNKIKDYDISKAENENTFTLKDGVIQGSIALYKTDDKGKGIQGVKFNLYKLADTAVTKASGSASYSLSGKLAALMYSSEAKLIVNNLTTDADGYWYSRECTKTYTDFAGSERTVSDGLTGGWYCFFETEAVGNVIKSDEAYLFCIREDADGNITITDAEGNSLLKGAIDINADGRYDIINTRITAYLRKEGVDKAGTSTELLTDPGKQLTLTLYEKQNGEWIKITDFKPGNVPVTDKSLAPYDGYSNDISQYLKTGKEYKIVETKPHSSLTYMKADDYYFKVDASGDLYPMTLQENGSFKVESKLEPAVIVMQDVEATMAIWNHYTHAGIFVCNLVDSRGRKIVADQTLTSYNENSAHDITVDGIESTPGGSTASLYMLQRGVEYTLTSTYYLTKDDYQNNRNGYTTTTVVTCDEYGQLVLADGRELTDNTFHIYGATQIVVRKVAADGVLEGYEIPGASLTLLQGGIQAPAVEYNGSAVEWSWKTDGYKPVAGNTNASGTSFTGTDGKTYVYEKPDGNLNARAGYVAGFSGATVFILRETEAPSGYKRAADIEFSFDDSGNIEILSGAENAQATVDDKGTVTITMKDEEGSDEGSDETPDEGPGGTSNGTSDETSDKSNNDSEAAAETGSSADGSSAGSYTASSAVQPEAAETDAGEQVKDGGRNVKTEDKTPIELYMILSVAVLGAFVILTLILKKKKSK